MRQGKIAPLARVGPWKGGSCLLKRNGTQRGIVIQDVHWFSSESLKECVNLGFIHLFDGTNIRPACQ